MAGISATIVVKLLFAIYSFGPSTLLLLKVCKAGKSLQHFTIEVQEGLLRCIKDCDQSLSSWTSYFAVV